MRFYRVHLTFADGVSAGYRWFTAESAAVKCAAQWRRDHKSVPDETARGDVTPCDIEPTKQGILAALNDFADHPDNG